MNTTNILLGTTSLLLVVAFALSFGGFSKSRESETSKEEIDALKEEIARMDAEARAFELARLRATSAPYLPVAPVNPLPTAPAAVEPAPISDDMKAIIKSQEDKIQALENENADLAIEKQTLEKENEEVFAEKKEGQDEQRMAAFRIKNALTMGTVTTANKENALVIFSPSASANFQPGRILAVRRNTGIIGRIEVDRLADTGEYVATMRPHGYSPDGYPDIQPGDTIIIDL